MAPSPGYFRGGPAILEPSGEGGRGQHDPNIWKEGQASGPHHACMRSESGTNDMPTRAAAALQALKNSHLFIWPDRSVANSTIVFMVKGQDTMNTTIAVTKDVTTLINILTVEPEKREHL